MPTRLPPSDAFHVIPPWLNMPDLCAVHAPVVLRARRENEPLVFADDPNQGGRAVWVKPEASWTYTDWMGYLMPRQIEGHGIVQFNHPKGPRYGGAVPNTIRCECGWQAPWETWIAHVAARRPGGR